MVTGLHYPFSMKLLIVVLFSSIFGTAHAETMAETSPSNMVSHSSIRQDQKSEEGWEDWRDSIGKMRKSGTLVRRVMELEEFKSSVKEEKVSEFACEWWLYRPDDFSFYMVVGFKDQNGHVDYARPLLAEKFLSAPKAFNEGETIHGKSMPLKYSNYWPDHSLNFEFEYTA